MVLGLMVLLALGCRKSQRPVYAVIPKSQGSIFWETVHAGAIAAARQANVDIIWNGAASESDFTRQIAIVDDLINRRPAGILLAPADRQALVPAIHRVREAGIPLSIFDSGADTTEFVSFVATDNYAGGVLAARRLAAILHGHGDVAMVAVMPGGASTVAREQGFTGTLRKEFPNLKLVAWQYGMSDRARSLAAAEDILTANPGLDGMFASNEASTIGAVQAIKGRGLAGKVKLVGFDTSPSLIDDVRRGDLDSLVIQNPFEIAYRGLKTLIDSHNGIRPVKEIDLPPTLIIQANLDEPETRQLINPDIRRYLKD